MPYNPLYSERTADTNLRVLANLQDINSITSVANGWLGKQSSGKDLSETVLRARRIEYFYDKMLMDTIKLGSENNVYLKYCTVKTLPEGNEKLLLRRLGALTEHTFPLAEGTPPKSDRMSSESYTGTFGQFGRYMEFTDRVDYMTIDPVIAHYSMELGDVAVRMAERLVREELIANAGPVYPGAKGFSSLVIGDTVGIADYRLQALKFQRLLVKPLANGKFNIICSPEHIYDLVSDPLVKEYMLYTNTAEPYTTGKPVPLFNLQFEETMLDDFAYGYNEMSHPGEYSELNQSEQLIDKLRLVVRKADGTILYLNATAGADNSKTVATIKRTASEGYLKDGSWIPQIVRWDIAGWQSGFTGETGVNTITCTDQNGDNVAVSATDLKASTIFELPVHRSFMFGSEFMYKTGIDGRMNAKFIVKEKGSAGVLDPIDQRQSVGFKIDTLGFNVFRPEAMVQFIFVPSQALLTYEFNIKSWDEAFNETYKTAATPGNVSVTIGDDQPHSSRHHNQPAAAAAE